MWLRLGLLARGMLNQNPRSNITGSNTTSYTGGIRRTALGRSRGGTNRHAARSVSGGRGAVRAVVGRCGARKRKAMARGALASRLDVARACTAQTAANRKWQFAVALGGPPALRAR